MLMKLGIVTVAIVGANMLIAGQINILVYIASISFSRQASTLPIEGIPHLYGDDRGSRRCSGAYQKRLKPCPFREGKLEMNPKDYSIDFKDVEFGYEDYTVINGVSFTAKQGEVTALIGPSGSVVNHAYQVGSPFLGYSER